MDQSQASDGRNQISVVLPSNHSVSQASATTATPPSNISSDCSSSNVSIPTSDSTKTIFVPASNSTSATSTIDPDNSTMAPKSTNTASISSTIAPSLSAKIAVSSTNGLTINESSLPSPLDKYEDAVFDASSRMVENVPASGARVNSEEEGITE